jgi:hypothetical protein
MKRLLLTMLCAAALFAQESVSRVIQLRHIHPDGTTAVLDTLAAAKVRWKVDGNLRIIALNGPAELVDAIDAAIKKLDVPRPAPPAAKNIEVTFHMLLASPQGESSAVPQELTGVAQQLRNVFGLKSIRVLETAILRGREGKGGSTSGLMAPPGKVDPPAIYSLRYQNTAISAGEKGANIRIDNLGFNAKLPLASASGAGYQFYDASINTDVDIREGQKVVVGKSSIDSASQSIFLVVTAKVVD